MLQIPPRISPLVVLCVGEGKAIFLSIGMLAQFVLIFVEGSKSCQKHVLIAFKLAQRFYGVKLGDDMKLITTKK